MSEKTKRPKIPSHKVPPSLLLKTHIPFVVNDCIQNLEQRDALTQEGIFRISGSVRDVKELTKIYSKGRCVSLSSFDVNTVANLLKSYLNDKKNPPVIPYELTEPFISAGEIQEAQEKISAIKSLVDSMPVPNQELFHKMIVFLVKVTRNSEQNKMSTTNMSTMFGPILLRLGDIPAQEMVKKLAVMNEVILVTLQNHQTVFEGWDDDIDSKPGTSIDCSESVTAKNKEAWLLRFIHSPRKDEEISPSTSPNESHKAYKSKSVIVNRSSLSPGSDPISALRKEKNPILKKSKKTSSNFSQTTPTAIPHRSKREARRSMSDISLPTIHPYPQDLMQDLQKKVKSLAKDDTDEMDQSQKGDSRKGVNVPMLPTKSLSDIKTKTPTSDRGAGKSGKNLPQDRLSRIVHIFSSPRKSGKLPENPPPTPSSQPSIKPAGGSSSARMRSPHVSAFSALPTPPSTPHSLPQQIYPTSSVKNSSGLALSQLSGLVSSPSLQEDLTHLPCSPTEEHLPRSLSTLDLNMELSENPTAKMNDSESYSDEEEEEEESQSSYSSSSETESE